MKLITAAAVAMTTVNYCETDQFLQRVSIACYAERCISYEQFCPSDRLSVTRWYHAKTT